MPEEKFQKRISREDVKRCREFAKELRDTPSARARMDMQLNFVHEMGAKYGREHAARLLTRIWYQIGKAEKEDRKCLRQ